MAKPTPNHALVFLMFAVSAMITCWLTSRPQAALFTPHLSSFPRTIGPWYDEDIPLDAEVLQVLKADEVIYRGYRNRIGEDPLSLLVVYRKYGRREFAHRPEACYPAAGWEIVDGRYTTVTYGGRNVRAVRVVAERNGQREITFYWFASGRETEANYVTQQLKMALDRIQTREYGWAFIRVTSRVMNTEEGTVSGMRHFLRLVSHPLADALTGSRTGAGARLPDSGRAKQ